MNESHSRKELNRIFRDLSDTLDVPPSKYQEAKDHYDAVGSWLGDDDSELAAFDPQIYPQGSFALGTAVRPIGNDEYDVDAVCLLQLSTRQVTQQQLKEMIGKRLKHPKSRYKEKIDPRDGSRRCWTIRYSDDSKFHLDILPSVPDDCGWLIALNVPTVLANHAIRITDKTTPEFVTGWPADGRSYRDPTRSNPKGYAEWFKDRMRVRLEEGRREVARVKAADVEEIEDFEVRTPLQRVIQILKRHRDIRYNGDDDKPISVIITTLAAKAYDNEADLYDTILKIVPGMRDNIEQRDGVWWIENPVNPLENFADKWQETPRKAELFFEWLDAIEEEYKSLLTDKGFKKMGTYLTESFGQRDGQAVMAKYASRNMGKAKPANAAPIVIIPRKDTTPATPEVNLPDRPAKPWSNRPSHG